MLRVRVAVGSLLAVLGTAAIVALGGDAPRAAPADDCVDPDVSYTTASLHDVRSFADAMAIVTGVKEEVPPPPDGPEGYAGFIGRVVTMKVERVLWRRPKAPDPPAMSRFTDLGWWGELEDRVPMNFCRETRMELGRRYLAPIVRQHGTWYPFFEVRMLLDGDRVVGGVDAGEPNHAHQALAGRSVEGAVRVVARTKPYRAVVRDPSGSPARRWQRAAQDRFRVWRQPPGAPMVVHSGVTARARWQLHMRRPRRGGLCLGMTVRPLWGDSLGAGGEGCGVRRLPRESVAFGTFSAGDRGVFAHGRSGRDIWDVRVRFQGEPWRKAALVPTEARTYVWVVPAEGDCPAVRVQGLGKGRRVLYDRRTAPRLPGLDPGEPNPYAAC